jgi:DNA-binding NarL/FixJ family response regulator
VTDVLIVDDHQMFGQAVSHLLQGEDDLRVTGVAGSAEEALAVCGPQAPDVVLMDVDLPGIDGITAISRVLQACPHTQVVVITALHDPALLSRAVDAGAAGFLSKSDAIEDLVSVIRRAANGEIVLPSERMEQLLRDLHAARRQALAGGAQESLTARELEVLQAFTDGLDAEGVAERLFITKRTVHSHVRNALHKLGVHSTLQAVLLCLRQGQLKLGQEGNGGRPPA